MRIDIQPVTPAGEAAVRGLQVAPEQRGFIESVADCLAEAHALSLWRPVALVSDGVTVGFAMYGRFPDEGAHGRVWLDRLLIDERYQGRGCGKAALRALLARLFEEYGCDAVYLSLYETNRVAYALYEAAGFVSTDEWDINGERVMRLDRVCWTG